MLPSAALSLEKTPIVVTGFFVAWPTARRWKESGARFFNETNSSNVSRLLARGDWNECGAELPQENDGAVQSVLHRAADEALRVLAERELTFDAVRCAVVFSSSKGELDLLPVWAARENENALPVGNAIIATAQNRAALEIEKSGDASTRVATQNLSFHQEEARASLRTASKKIAKIVKLKEARYGFASTREESGEDFLPWTPDAPARVLARRLGAGGAVLSPVAACAGGAHSVILGAQLIEDGRADCVVCGALEAGLSPLMMAGYSSLGALSKGDVMRPFDGARDGFLPSEGLAMLILESAKSAQRRGARVLATVSGGAMNADATAMTTMQPDGKSIARAIEIAQAKANARAAIPIDYVNAHATATKLNDALEARALARTLGENVAVGATKSATGHWLGAAGALEAVLSVLALRDGFLPPCLGLSRRGDDIARLDFVENGGREFQARRALSLSYGFGGHIGALIFDAP